jgi:hypothetical protein
MAMGAVKKINLLIRGHVRSSFNDERLITLVRSFAQKYELSIFLHTWNVVQNRLSWRHMEDIPNEVSEKVVRSYFQELDPLVKMVIIDDDKKIKLQGNTKGNIGRTPCPVLAWKNMYYGKLRLIEAVSELADASEVAVQTRFDLLSNNFSPKIDEVVDFLDSNYESVRNGDVEERIRFLRMHCFLGMDNIYMASVSNMQIFIRHMYFDMDRILRIHENTIHQEHISFHERKAAFENNQKTIHVIGTQHSIIPDGTS